MLEVIWKSLTNSSTINPHLGHGWSIWDGSKKNRAPEILLVEWMNLKNVSWTPLFTPTPSFFILFDSTWLSQELKFTFSCQVWVSVIVYQGRWVLSISLRVLRDGSGCRNRLRCCFHFGNLINSWGAKAVRRMFVKQWHVSRSNTTEVGNAICYALLRILMERVSMLKTALACTRG